jgi:chromosome segregation and condensation protein ScpB
VALLAQVTGSSIGDVRRGLATLAEELHACGMTVLDDGTHARLAPVRELLRFAAKVAQPRRRRRWSMPQMETLALAIAHGATTKREVEDVRGVDSGELLAGLTAQGYLAVNVDDAAVGRPHVYRPTSLVLEVFGANTIEELRAGLGVPAEGLTPEIIDESGGGP